MPIYQRLVVILHLRADRRRTEDLDTNDVYIKLFKDIPQDGSRNAAARHAGENVAEDRVKIILPTLSGLAISV